MKRPTRDGTTRLVLDPVDFLRRLVSLIPPPRSHLTRYHGALASHSRDRAQAIASRPAGPDPASALERRPQWRLPWAELLGRVYAVELFLCNQCGGRRRILAAITDPQVARKILDHLRLPAGLPRTAPPRAPPQSRLPWDAYDPCVDPIPAEP